MGRVLLIIGGIALVSAAVFAWAIWKDEEFYDEDGD